MVNQLPKSLISCIISSIFEFFMELFLFVPEETEATLTHAIIDHQKQPELIKKA
jgi:hypothetical protein